MSFDTGRLAEFVIKSLVAEGYDVDELQALAETLKGEETKISSAFTRLMLEIGKTSEGVSAAVAQRLDQGNDRQLVSALIPIISRFFIRSAASSPLLTSPDKIRRAIRFAPTANRRASNNRNRSRKNALNRELDEIAQSRAKYYASRNRR